MMRQMQDEMDRFFGQIVAPPAFAQGESMSTWAPTVDISENEREWLVEAERVCLKSS